MNPRILNLVEYETISFPADYFTEELAKDLDTRFRSQVEVDPPSSFKNQQEWRLTSQGWVGYIPLSESTHFALAPKVPIQSIYGMLEYAYRLKGFKILDGLADSASIRELYERLALVLARQVLLRIRQGLYKEYVGEADDLQFVRGRIDIQEYIRKSSLASLPCSFEEHTEDIEDNQLLLWTIERILFFGFCTDRSCSPPTSDSAT